MKKKSIIFIVLILVVICITASGCFTKEITENVDIQNANFVFEKVAGEVIESTVTISCPTGNGGTTSGGAGVVISEDGHILTNYHVIKEHASSIVYVTFAETNNSTTSGKTFTADILKEKNIGELAKYDLAVLKIRGLFNSDFKPVKIKANPVKWGEYGVIIGNPKQIGSLCAHAMVSNPKMKISHNVRGLHYIDFITIDAPVNPGNSGGGFFDSQGRLAGIVTLRHYDDSNSNKNVIFGIGYAIPAECVVSYLKAYDIKLAE